MGKHSSNMAKLLTLLVCLAVFVSTNAIPLKATQVSVDDVVPELVEVGSSGSGSGATMDTVDGYSSGSGSGTSMDMGSGMSMDMSSGSGSGTTMDTVDGYSSGSGSGSGSGISMLVEVGSS